VLSVEGLAAWLVISGAVAATSDALALKFILSLAVVAAVGGLLWPWLMRRRAQQNARTVLDTTPVVDGTARRFEVRTAPQSMTIGEFYASDGRRRGTNELDLGSWRDTDGRKWHLGWVPTTGELYAMREPENLGLPNGRGGWTYGQVKDRDLTTRVLAVIGMRAQVEEILAGRQTNISDLGGLVWVIRKLGQAPQ
jgi:hypothetical protein